MPDAEPVALLDLPLRTERLTIDAITLADAPALTALRNDPEIARLQDWDLPYTRAEASIAGQPEVVAAGTSTNLAIRLLGSPELIGDVYVGIDEDAATITIGYSLATAHQGCGYITEAVGTVVDALLQHASVHRFVATLDPTNAASARVLESTGFRYEGRTKESALIRGEWLDDDCYALLRSDREAWLGRDRSRPADVRFVEFGFGTERAYYRLATHQSQRSFVASMPDSFADALMPFDTDGRRLVPWMRGVEADGVAVGFVMIGEANEQQPEPYLWRLLIDRFHQRRGIGDRVLDLVIDELRARGFTSMTTSWGTGSGSPERFYLRRGFEPTGELDDDEVVARLRFGLREPDGGTP